MGKKKETDLNAPQTPKAPPTLAQQTAKVFKVLDALNPEQKLGVLAQAAMKVGAYDAATGFISDAKALKAAQASG